MTSEDLELNNNNNNGDIQPYRASLFKVAQPMTSFNIKAKVGGKRGRPGGRSNLIERPTVYSFGELFEALQIGLKHWTTSDLLAAVIWFGCN